MVKRFSSRDARANFSELLGMVYYTKEPVIVERKGKPYAVLISPEQYAVFVDQQEQAWHIIDQVRAGNADEDPDAVLADVTAEVDAVRRERHDEQRRSGQRGR